MKIDIRKNITLDNSLQVPFTVVLFEQMMRVYTFIHQSWQTQLLRNAIRSERRTLSRLTDKELDDIGINRATAVAESQRKYTDLPTNRLR